MCTGFATSDRVFSVERFADFAGVYHASESLQVDGGAAANAAISVAGLGGRSSFIGCVGDDEVGDRVLLRLAAAGVDIRGVQRVDKATPVRTVVQDAAGHRVVFAYVVDGFFDGCDLSPAAEIGDADAVLVDSRWTAGSAQTLAAAHAAGVPAVAGINHPLRDDLADFLELATHVVFTCDALMETVGVSDAHMALKELSRTTSAWVGVTKGPQGVSWIHQHGLQHQAAFEVGCDGAVAAGDVFRGAFALALAEGRPADSAVLFATGAAAAKCRHNGASVDMPCRAEVEALLASDPPFHL